MCTYAYTRTCTHMYMQIQRIKREMKSKQSQAGKNPRKKEKGE